jgi:hypothetical protein
MSKRPTPRKPRPAEPELPVPAKDKICQLVRDGSSGRYRILIRCAGEPDVCLLDLGSPPDVSLIHAEGSSGAGLR